MVLVSFPPKNFACSLCSFYWLQELKKYDVGMIFNGIKSIPKFLKFGQIDQKLKEETRGQTRRTDLHIHI